jgi:hypothetical protein
MMECVMQDEVHGWERYLVSGGGGGGGCGCGCGCGVWWGGEVRYAGM